MIPDLAPLLAMNMTEIALWGAGGLIVVMLGLMMVYSIFRAFYQKVDQGFALINNTMSQTPKVTFTGMLVIPIIHRTEVMDISVKTIQVDRRGKDGLICSDNVRADITVAFYVRVNKTAEDVLQVASAVGVKRASDQKTLEELFQAKFSEALKTVGKQLEFVALYNERQNFKEMILKTIGRDLNGYSLEDTAIDYLEQTPIEFLDDENILDAEGKRKIIELTASRKMAANAIQVEAEKVIKKQNVEGREAILALERQQAEAEAIQARDIAVVRAREQAEVDKVQAEQTRRAQEARIAAEESALAALDAVRDITGEKQANVIGYCLGGTLLASTLAWLPAKRQERIRSATFFVTMIDFERPGELEVFIDEQQIGALEKKMEARGYLEGSEMATTFNMLRANDLIWSFVVNNYLLGRDPFPFDLLYWNGDSTRMPAKMHSFYLRNMYLKNLLRLPGGITLAGVPIDIGKVKTPAYFISTIEDHIAPWQSTYAGAQLLKGPVRFVLGGSGHIAGIINPPDANKYGYWINEEPALTAGEWLKGATQHAGSWWTDWQQWVSGHGGDKADARKPGNAKYKPIEDAPGSYVQRRIG